jgi:hypothetical protein
MNHSPSGSGDEKEVLASAENWILVVQLMAIYLSELFVLSEYKQATSNHIISFLVITFVIC